MIFSIQLLIYCNDNNILREEANHFGGEASTLDRTHDRILSTDLKVRTIH